MQISRNLSDYEVNPYQRNYSEWMGGWADRPDQAELLRNQAINFVGIFYLRFRSTVRTIDNFLCHLHKPAGKERLFLLCLSICLFDTSNIVPCLSRSTLEQLTFVI